MKTFLCKDRGRAEQVLNLLRPEATERTCNIFLNKVDRHLGADYSGGLGLKLLGLNDKRCVNYVEIHECPKTGWDVDWMVAVETADGWEAFDKMEATCYDVYIKAAPHRERLESEVKQEHFNKRLQEPLPCEESA
jgi:hypothetical protein